MEKGRASKWESRRAIFFFHGPLDVFEVCDLKEGEFFFEGVVGLKSICLVGARWE